MHVEARGLLLPPKFGHHVRENGPAVWLGLPVWVLPIRDAARPPLGVCIGSRKTGVGALVITSRARGERPESRVQT